MSKLIITSDLHLGHKNAFKFRPVFESPEEHDFIVFDNLASSIGKRDTVYFLGDIAFTHEWLDKIKNIKCASKVIILGNHDTERGIKPHQIADTYDKVYSLYSKRNMWFSHCPIHPDEMRGRAGNIHGHKHEGLIEDDRYFNVCLEHTEYKPVLFSTIQDYFNESK